MGELSVFYSVYMGELFVDLIETLYDIGLRSVIRLYMIGRPYNGL